MEPPLHWGTRQDCLEAGMRGLVASGRAAVLLVVVAVVAGMAAGGCGGSNPAAVVVCNGTASRDVSRGYTVHMVAGDGREIWTEVACVGYWEAPPSGYRVVEAGAAGR